MKILLTDTLLTNQMKFSNSYVEIKLYRYSRVPNRHPPRYLIRTNFRAGKFSRIFAQNLYLREIARKLYRIFEISWQVRENLSARKLLKKKEV